MYINTSTNKNENEIIFFKRRKYSSLIFTLIKLIFSLCPGSEQEGLKDL